MRHGSEQATVLVEAVHRQRDELAKDGGAQRITRRDSRSFLVC